MPNPSQLQKVAVTRIRQRVVIPLPPVLPSPKPNPSFHVSIIAKMSLHTPKTAKNVGLIPTLMRYWSLIIPLRMVSL